MSGIQRAVEQKFQNSLCPRVWFSSLSGRLGEGLGDKYTVYIDVLFAVSKLNHRYSKSKTRENWNKLTFS